MQTTFQFMEELLAPEDLRHNKLRDADRAFHDWYRFVLSYPPHLVKTYRTDDDDLSISDNSKINAIAEEIERRRVALGKDSGFERLYHRVTKLYFGGMKRHFEQVKRVLKPGAKLAYVVGDQASYLQVLIRTGELLADIAHEAGYDVLSLDLFRTRLSTATGHQLREEVLVLEWPGEKRMAKKSDLSRYDQLIERVFFKNYTDGASEVRFGREEFVAIAQELGIELPKNLGDIIYSYRYRNKLPAPIRELLAPDQEWLIRSEGRARYVFAKRSYPSGMRSTTGSSRTRT
jgi:hypothetical protein